MSARILLRWAALGAPYPWFGFATRFKATREVVGVDFFEKFARRVHSSIVEGSPGVGLMASLDDLASSTFDPRLVHPLIRDFYEHTSNYDLDYTIHWNPLIRPLGWLYDRLLASAMKQLIIPMDRDTLCRLDSWLEVLHAAGTSPDVRCWIRIDPESNLPVYIGAYRTYTSVLDDIALSYVSVAFPIPGGTITTVLSPQNGQNGEMSLTTKWKESTENGLYLILPGKHSFAMLPAFGLAEHFHLCADETSSPFTLRVQHDCRWLGLKAFTLHYTITPMRQRPTLLAEKMLAIADRGR